jgi:hypothetical protein
MPVCDDINAKIHVFSEKIYLMTDKANLGTDEATWKTTLDDLQISVINTFLATDPLNVALDSIYHDYCIDPNSVDPSLNLYKQQVSFLMATTATIIKKLHNIVLSKSSEFYNTFCVPTLFNIKSSVEKFGYAQWKGYGTPWDWSVKATDLFSEIQFNSTFTNSLTNESITDTYEIMYARIFHEAISISITRLQATLPNK